MFLSNFLLESIFERGIFFENLNFPLMSSDFSLTSIICEFGENSLTNCPGSIVRIFSVEYPADFQLSIPESKYPIQLSKPTLDSLVIASSSFPFSTIDLVHL